MISSDRYGGRAVWSVFQVSKTMAAADHATYSNKNETKNDKIAMKVSKQAKKLL